MKKGNVLLEPDKVEILLTKCQKKILIISKGKKNNLLVKLLLIYRFLTEAKAFVTSLGCIRIFIIFK